MKIEAHEAEILCVEFSDPTSGMIFIFFAFAFFLAWIFSGVLNTIIEC